MKKEVEELKNLYTNEDSVFCNGSRLAGLAM